MNLRPGDVTPSGDILCNDGVLLSDGMVYVNLEQALKARRFGWRIRSAVVNGKDAFFAVRRRTTHA